MITGLNIIVPHKKFIDPRSVPGLNVWYDANVGLYDTPTGGALVTANGASIARWEDRSGNGFHLKQNSPTNRPTLLTGALNGLKGVNFNGTSSCLSELTTNAGNLLSLKLFIFIVFKFSSYNGLNSVAVINKDGGYASGVAGRWSLRRWDMAPYGGSNGQFMSQVHTNGQWEFGVGNYTSTSYGLTHVAFPRTTAHTFNATIDVNETNVATRAGLSDNGAPGAATAHMITLGARCTGTAYTPGEFFNGVICESAVYLRNSDLSKNERQSLIKYFRKKWNV